jgi:hypothetical protein
MEQMIIDPAVIVDIDFTAADVDRTLKTLQPVVFREGEQFCCHLGPNMEQGILGKGDSPGAAIEAWKAALKQRVETAGEDDELATFVKDSLNFTKNDVW